MSKHENHEDCCSPHDHTHSHECCGHTHQHSCESDCHSHHHKYSEELLALADEAWMEVIKHKIKEEILKSSGDHLSELATIIAKANHAKWMYKLDEKKNQEDYEIKLHNLLLSKQKT